MPKEKQRENHRILRWIVWSLAVLFYFYEVFLRISPTAMVPQLMNAFNADAGALGTLSAFYLYIYAPMQIPVGLLMDRLGSRRLLTLAAFLCGIGAFIFGASHALWLAEASRAFMGFGSAFAFVGLIYICSTWFPPAILALVIGLGNSLGMLGGVAAEGPLAYVVDIFGWRTSMIASGFFGVALAVAIFLSVRSKEAPTHIVQQRVGSWKDLLSGLKTVCSNIHTWINGAIALLLFASTTAFAGLWGTPFLRALYGISAEEAGFAVSMVFIGWVVGGPLIGLFSDRLRKRRPVLMISSLLGFACITTVIYAHIPITLISILLFLVGFFSSAQLLNFSVGIEINPPGTSGTAAAFTNFFITLGGAVLQPLVGIFLDMATGGAGIGGARIYSVADYHWALSVFPISFVAAFILTLFLKEKRPV